MARRAAVSTVVATALVAVPARGGVGCKPLQTLAGGFTDLCFGEVEDAETDCVVLAHSGPQWTGFIAAEGSKGGRLLQCGPGGTVHFAEGDGKGVFGGDPTPCEYTNDAGGSAGGVIHKKVVADEWNTMPWWGGFTPPTPSSFDISCDKRDVPLVSYTDERVLLIEDKYESDRALQCGHCRAVFAGLGLAPDPTVMAGRATSLFQLAIYTSQHFATSDTDEAADTSGGANVEFFGSSGWSSKAEIHPNGVFAGERAAEWFDSTKLRCPTKLRLSVATSKDGKLNEDAWGFWKVVLRQQVVSQDPNGPEGSRFDSALASPSPFWLTAKQPLVIDIPSGILDCVGTASEAATGGGGGGGAAVITTVVVIVIVLLALVLAIAAAVYARHGRRAAALVVPPRDDTVTLNAVFEGGASPEGPVAVDASPTALEVGVGAGDGDGAAAQDKDPGSTSTVLFPSAAVFAAHAAATQGRKSAEAEHSDRPPLCIDGYLVIAGGNDGDDDDDHNGGGDEGGGVQQQQQQQLDSDTSFVSRAFLAPAPADVQLRVTASPAAMASAPVAATEHTYAEPIRRARISPALDTSGYVAHDRLPPAALVSGAGAGASGVYGAPVDAMAEVQAALEGARPLPYSSREGRDHTASYGATGTAVTAATAATAATATTAATAAPSDPPPPSDAAEHHHYDSISTGLPAPIQGLEPEALRVAHELMAPAMIANAGPDELELLPDEAVSVPDELEPAPDEVGPAPDEAGWVTEGPVPVAAAVIQPRGSGISRNDKNRKPSVYLGFGVGGDGGGGAQC